MCGHRCFGGVGARADVVGPGAQIDEGAIAHRIRGHVEARSLRAQIGDEGLERSVRRQVVEVVDVLLEIGEVAVELGVPVDEKAQLVGRVSRDHVLSASDLPPVGVVRIKCPPWIRDDEHSPRRSPHIEASRGSPQSNARVAGVSAGSDCVARYSARAFAIWAVISGWVETQKRPAAICGRMMSAASRPLRPAPIMSCITRRWVAAEPGSRPCAASAKMRVATGPGSTAETEMGAPFASISRRRHSLNESTACLLRM